MELSFTMETTMVLYQKLWNFYSEWNFDILWKILWQYIYKTMELWFTKFFTKIWNVDILLKKYGATSKQWRCLKNYSYKTLIFYEKKAMIHWKKTIVHYQKLWNFDLLLNYGTIETRGQLVTSLTWENSSNQ